MSSFSKNKISVKTILLATLVAGTLDMLAAILVYDLIMQRVTAMQILHSIYAALFGKTIIGNEAVMAFIGLILHYFIAFCFAAVYFLLFPYISFLRKHAILSGLLYGVIVWFIMNILVVPTATGNHYVYSMPAFLRQVITLMICIGPPISLITANYYKNKQLNS